jgi:PleD family two-component response regulator
MFVCFLRPLVERSGTLGGRSEVKVAIYAQSGELIRRIESPPGFLCPLIPPSFVEKNGRILIIDDDRDVLQAARIFLRQQGFQVDVEERPIHVLQLLRTPAC